jgi:hypothetical protein
MWRLALFFWHTISETTLAAHEPQNKNANPEELA